MVAAILAGGESRRMGTPKAALRLGDRTLLEHAVVTAREAALRPVVVAKPGMALPTVDAERWDEPAEPRHPLTGLRAALARAGPAGCVALACDTPFVPASLLRALAGCSGLTFVRAGGRLHPLPGRYVAPLPAEGALLSLDAAILDWAVADDLLNVNSPGDLELASARLQPPR
jgi:molybdopterin-guanine dinucleotide biosynthesis protein A